MSDDAASVLNGLIETAKDGELGYRTAAEKVKEPQLKSLFSKYSQQRASYAQELQTAVSSLGEKPAESGHAAATLHRGWMNLKQALTKDEDTALVDEAESGEDVAKKAYSEALQKTLPANIKTIVQRQYDGVLEAHNVVRNLKHSREASAKA